uniref:Uncharacterized protein n=1 Tax=Mimiviridae sp. ChoanoV1 TaxID=2596887 RepID=A0A5B8INN7_9VIRU|nr:hypothetical protein 1_56 [Mimiviridae sp. ChoanoV1]
MNELKIIFLLIIFVFLLCVCNNYEYFGRVERQAKRDARRTAKALKKKGRKAKRADKRSESLSEGKQMEITFQNPAYKQCQHDLNTLLDKFPRDKLKTTLGIETVGLNFQGDTNKIDYETYGHDKTPNYPELYGSYSDAPKTPNPVSEKIQVFADIGLIGNKKDKICLDKP